MPPTGPGEAMAPQHHETLKLLGRQDLVSLMVLTRQADAGDRVQRRYATPERHQPLTCHIDHALEAGQLTVHGGG
jgi:hypothetical protein